MRVMTCVVPLVLGLVTTAAHADTDTSCEVRIVRAPAEVRAAIEARAGIESECAELEVRVVVTAEGFYVIGTHAGGVPFDRLRDLSMGMSQDFEVAIEEGATMVRVGTAIFGVRPG